MESQAKKRITNGIYDGEEIDFTLPEKPLERVIISKENNNLIPDFGSLTIKSFFLFNFLFEKKIKLIVEKDILHPILYISPKNETIFDFGQNMVGFVRFKGFLEKNQKIKIRHEKYYKINVFLMII